MKKKKKTRQKKNRKKSTSSFFHGLRHSRLFYFVRRCWCFFFAFVSVHYFIHMSCDLHAQNESMYTAHYMHIRRNYRFRNTHIFFPLHIYVYIHSSVRPSCLRRSHADLLEWRHMDRGEEEEKKTHMKWVKTMMKWNIERRRRRRKMRVTSLMKNQSVQFVRVFSVHIGPTDFSMEFSFLCSFLNLLCSFLSLSLSPSFFYLAVLPDKNRTIR